MGVMMKSMMPQQLQENRMLVNQVGEKTDSRYSMMKKMLNSQFNSQLSFNITRIVVQELKDLGDSITEMHSQLSKKQTSDDEYAFKN